ncbi:FAD-dependent oxidoreductase [uncultured Mailhella sp.]|uniref:FAD-dependent oxidoreductase n=1 Tax=uncultured Mailhella sp. TaxID=1981031 RepID=UPI002627523E|nr:FAD-dependent oxidoreductase [uncultured Mailhella sp.]
MKKLVVSGFQKRQSRTSPCEASCPAGNRIQAVETLLKAGKPTEAHAVLLTRNPFPGVTGRICTHPCEMHCNRRKYDEGVSIRALERFAADTPFVSRLTPRVDTKKKVAIIGSGPAGMTCAYFLRLMGHAVTVFEAGAVLGGVPRMSVPDFRLPKNIVERETGHILSLGVTAHTNVRVGQDVALSTIMESYDATVVAIGNQKERILDIPGHERLVPAVSFLSSSNLARRSLAGKNVVVLGGGGVAFDCAFTAKRLNAASVSLVFPEAQDAIKAPAEEVEQARMEGISLHASCLAIGVENGVVKAARLEKFTFSDTGELIAKFHEGKELTLTADTVICASGLLPDMDFLEGLSLERTARGHLIVDEFQQTSAHGLFAAGDIVTGPATVASAVGSGRKTAIGVHCWLEGLEQFPEVYFRENEDDTLELSLNSNTVQQEQHVVLFEEIENPSYHEHAPRQHSACARTHFLPFEEFDTGFTTEQAQAEASRCMHCGHCIDCGTCVERCPNYILDRDEDGPFVHYPEECWHCACCRIGCPTGAIAIEFPITMLV